MKLASLKEKISTYSYLWPFAFTIAIIVVVIIAAVISLPALTQRSVPNSLILEPYIDTTLEDDSLQVVAIKIGVADPNDPPKVAELVFNYDPTKIKVDRIIGYEGTLYLNNKVDDSTGIANIDIAHVGDGAFTKGTTIGLIYIDKLLDPATLQLDLGKSVLGYPNNIDPATPVEITL
jgi:hypothetical protein